ncbi:hypothetical protein [Coraliomargarita sinensis]|nr:hypothetical protein [Coraliomargarita sinensis]
MKINLQTAEKICSNYTLPKELNTRLRCVMRQKSYTDQIDTFSMVFPHSEETAVRWYLHHQEMPYMHILETHNHGNTMFLYVWVPRLRSAVILEKQFSTWDLSAVVSETALLDHIPNRFLESNAAWLKKPASKSQMYTAARQLLMPVHRIPKLTAFNAQLIIQTSILKRHLQYVCRLVEEIIEDR